MNKLLILSTFIIICGSCVTQRDSYQYFYKSNIDNAEVALSLPKWAIIPFLDKEDRDTVKYLSKGMKKTRILVSDEDHSLFNSFEAFVRDNSYNSYLFIQEDDKKIKLYVKETETTVDEIVLSFGSRDESVLIGILGKMSKSDFQKEIGPRLLEISN